MKKFIIFAVMATLALGASAEGSSAVGFLLRVDRAWAVIFTVINVIMRIGIILFINPKV